MKMENITPKPASSHPDSCLRRPDASTATAEERRAELSRDNGLEGSSARVLENNGAAQDANKEKQLLVDEEDVSGAACCYPERDLPVIFYKMITCLIAGIIFGCALEKGRGTRLIQRREKNTCRPMQSL